MKKSQSLNTPISQFITMKKIRFGISIDEGAVRALDETIEKKGRFANRSQGIEYCVKQVLALEGHKRGSMELLIDFLELLEKQPKIGKEFRVLLKEEQK
ncbi:MAG: hypothetical protein KAT65_12650 [Methanophagales archaeon]|nr:hypothetical protein [Methanophagales archaeon]